jgi:hypothetical protein
MKKFAADQLIFALLVGILILGMAIYRFYFML